MCYLRWIGNKIALMKYKVPGFVFDFNYTNKRYTIKSLGFVSHYRIKKKSSKWVNMRKNFSLSENKKYNTCVLGTFISVKL